MFDPYRAFELSVHLICCWRVCIVYICGWMVVKMLFGSAWSKWVIPHVCHIWLDCCCRVYLVWTLIFGSAALTGRYVSIVRSGGGEITTMYNISQYHPHQRHKKTRNLLGKSSRGWCNNSLNARWISIGHPWESCKNGQSITRTTSYSNLEVKRNTVSAFSLTIFQ